MRIALLTALFLTLCLAPAAQADEKKESDSKKGPALLNHDVKTIDGKKVNLAEKYGGKVVMVVNVASKCGHTPQYADLQALHETYAEQGLAVLGFPCNQFGNQEPGSDEQIQQFCEVNYGVTFDMFSKIDVNGENAAPLYAYLTGEELPVEDRGPIGWNFEKFLIDRDGEVIARFRSGVNPQSEEVVTAIEAALAQEVEAPEGE